jgi:type I restriction enzyme S subunit
VLRLKWETSFEQRTEIGNVPKDWEYRELETIAYVDKSIKKTSNCKKVAFIAMDGIPTDCYIPSFEVTYLENVRSGREVLPNSILVAKITPSFEHGKMCIVPTIIGIRWFATTEVFSINPKSDYDLKFIFYLLKHPCLRDILENSMSGTSGRQRVQSSALKNLRVPCPAYSEQSRIGVVLSWFDDLIENQKKQNEILEKTAMAIFRNWFVDFEPFKDGAFAQSDLRNIPAGWEFKRISEIFDFVKGKKCDISEEYTEGSNPYLLVETYDTVTKRYWTTEKEPFVDELDIVLIADGANSGRVLRFQKGILGSTLLTLRPSKDNDEIRHFVYLLFKSMEQELKGHTTGTYLQHLDKNYLASLPIPFPPYSILKDFNALVEPIFRKLILNQEQIISIRKAKDVLLPLLVFGKLRVEEV